MTYKSGYKNRPWDNPPTNTQVYMGEHPSKYHQMMLHLIYNEGQAGSCRKIEYSAQYHIDNSRLYYWPNNTRP